MLSQKQNQLILLEIWIEIIQVQVIQTCFSLLKKRKKQFYIFQKEQLQYYDFILF